MLNSGARDGLRDRCYKFGLAIIELTNALPNKRSAWVIGDQILRSATSIGANVVEARASSSRLEYKKYFEIALKSANETEYWLQLLKDAKLAESSRIDVLAAEVTQLCKMLGASVIKLKQKTNF